MATSTLTRIARWLGAALVVGLSVWLVWRSTDDLGTAITELSVPTVIGAGALAILGTVAMQRCWRALLDGLLPHPAPRAAARVFYVSQLGKYLPGSVWPVVAQMEFGRRWGIGRTVMVAANLLFLGTLIASGIATGLILLPWSGAGHLGRYWWLLLALIPLAVALHPSTLPQVLDWVRRRFHRPPLEITMRAAALRRALMWSAAAWVAMGAHVLVLSSAFSAIGEVGLRQAAAATGAIALGWAAGILFIPAPAGAGVRDSVIVLALAPFLGTTPAVTVALASRVLLILADGALAALAALLAVPSLASPRYREKTRDANNDV